MSSGRRSVCSPPERDRKMPAKDKGKRKVADLEVVGGKLSARGQLENVVREVRDGLSEKNLEAFRRSCFGFLLEVPQIQPQMQVIFLMLSSLQSGSDKRDLLSFMINGRTVELGPKEFYCITSLSFKDGGRLPTSSKMHRDIFRGDMNLRATDIQQAFRNYCVKHDGTGSLVLKLALLHVLYGLLLNRDQIWKKIEIDYMHLVDDIGRFNKYPWGRVAYDFVVYWTHRARMNVDRLAVNSDRPSTDICGFYITLQIFAYEVMPMLALHCARRIDGVAFPRICRWTANSFFKYTVLLPYFQSSDVNTIVMNFSLPQYDERRRMSQAGVSEGDAVQRSAEVSGRKTVNSIDLNLVDFDRSAELKAAETEKMEHGDDLDTGNKSIGEQVFRDRGKRKVDEDVEEVLPPKLSQSSSGRRTQRENAARLGQLLKEATESHKVGGSKPPQGMSFQNLSDLMLDLKAMILKQGESMTMLSHVIRGINSRMDSVVLRLSSLEKSVGLMAINTRFVSAEDVDASVLNKGAQKGLGADGDEGLVKEDASVNITRSCEKGVGKEIGKQAVLASFEEGLSLQGAGGDGKLLGQDEKAAGSDLLEGDKIYEGGDCCGANVAPEAHCSPSQEFELSDIAAYQPDPCHEEIQSAHPSAKKRLFEETMDRSQPAYGAITGEPLLKKQKTRGGKGKQKKDVQLLSLMLERFVPHRDYHWDVERSFSQWYSRCRDKKGSPTIKLPTECKDEADAAWFVPLYSAKGWLTDEHIDVLLNLLIIHSQKWPGDFKDNWTVIECMATQTLMLESMHESPERILPYVEGHYPHQGGKPWHEVEVVYGVGNVGEDHWVLLAIDLLQQRVILFDSLSSGHANWDDLKRAFVNICSNVPRLVEMLDVDRDRAVKPVQKAVWDMMRYEHPPQQANTSDCGVFALKSLECLVTGQPFSAINPSSSKAYRRGYCIELFANNNVIEEGLEQQEQ